MVGKTIIVSCLFRFRNVGRKSGPAKRGHLQNFILKMEMGQPETTTYEKTIPKKPPDLSGYGVRSYVEILGCSLQKQIPDTSTYQIGDETESVEPVECTQGVGAYLLP
jgi:hypothetical protein